MDDTKEILRMRLPLDVLTVGSIIKAVHDCMDENQRIMVHAAEDDPKCIVLLSRRIYRKPKGAPEAVEAYEDIGGGP